MKLAILLMHCSDAPRVTTLTREWVHRAVGHVAGYFVEQSGERENLEFRVLDWVQLPFTGQQWNDFGFQAGAQVKPVVAAALGVDLSPFDRFALVIDKSDAVLAAVAPDGVHVHVGAQSLDPALFAHELGHFYGANHANLDAPTGPIEYGDNYCVMGGEGSKFSFVHEPLNFTDADGNVTAAFSDSGPGMVAPSLMACGWLDVTTHGVDVGPALQSPMAQATVEIAALQGAPGPHRPLRPVCAWADGVLPDQRVVMEYRIREGVDRGMPDPGGGGNGWVVIHATSGSGQATTCLQLAAMPAMAGAAAYVPRGSLGIRVAVADPIQRTVILRAELERQPSLYAAIWEKATGPAWQARHGLTAAQYQQTFTELLAQGYRLVDVSGHTSSGQDRYAAIWRQVGGPEWHGRHGLTAAQYQQTFTEMVAQGFRLIDVSGYAVDGQDRYASIWEKATGPAWQARHGLTAAQYQQTFDELTGLGFRLVKVSGYAVGGQDRYAAIWEQREGPAWQARHGLTAAQYQQTFDELTGLGFRLVDISGYAVDGQDRYAAIWEQREGPEWQARHGLTAFQYQQAFDELAGLGYQLVNVTGFNPLG